MPPIPPVPNIGNKPGGKELSPYERGLITGAVAGGATLRKTAALFGIPISTVQSTVSRASTRANGVTKPRSGRPRKVSDRDRQYIVQLVRTQPAITYEDIIARTGVSASKKTIYRIIREHGLTNWLGRSRPKHQSEERGSYSGGDKPGKAPTEEMDQADCHT